MRLLVCGGRDFKDTESVFSVLTLLHKQAPISLIIEGGAKGADRAARQWAASRMIRCTTEPANWKKFGKRAGPIRNRAMLEKHFPDTVLAFPGGMGTANMVKLAREAGVVVVEVGHELSGSHTKALEPVPR